MRILVAHFGADVVSGAERAIADMIDRRSSDIEYVMLTPGGGELADFYRARGDEVWPRRVETRRRRYPGIHSLQSALFARALRRKRIDAVVCNTFPAVSRVGTACRWAGVPCAVYVREFIRKTQLQRLLLARSDMVLAVSNDVAGYLSDAVASVRLRVCSDHLNAGPLEDRLARHRRAGRRLVPFGPSNPVVGIIGRISRYKQQDLFVRAIPLILTATPDARFVVVGTSIPAEREYEEEVRTLAAQLGVSESVRFLGHRTDALEILSELAVCCLTSDREPFPRTILEAQLAGCPVVASDTGGCAEMVRDGESGLLFPPNANDSPSLFADRVVRILRDPSLARGLASRARARLLDGAASERPVRHFEDTLRSLASDYQGRE